jgi:hypothetical protein
MKFLTAQTPSGFASVQFLIMLLFLSITAGSAGLYVSSLIKQTEAAEQYNSAFIEMRDLLTGVLEDLRADPDPGSNGPGDPIWARNGTTAKGYTITIDPLSDRLNPNFIRKNIFEKTALSRLLSSGETPEGLQQWREDAGLSLSADHYGRFFTGEIFERYFSGYGWANINLTDEFAAQKLALSLTGSPRSAELIRGTIQTLLINQEQANRESLSSVLSSHYDEVFPFINAEPLININFVDPDLLRELIAYPDYGVSSPGTRCGEILAVRSGGISDTGEIAELLGIDPANPLTAYLGCITWFWKIGIAGEKGSLETILCRLPPDPLNLVDDPVYAIIEQRYY